MLMSVRHREVTMWIIGRAISCRRFRRTLNKMLLLAESYQKTIFIFVFKIQSRTPAQLGVLRTKHTFSVFGVLPTLTVDYRTRYG